MCRLFAFRSVVPSQVHRSLVGAENALLHQSTLHPDGWGVAYYHGGCPHVIKSVTSAIDDRIFKRVSGIVASETVVAHLRRATAGELDILNTHPFQFGKWIFVHNGNIKDFQKVRSKLIGEILPEFQRYILGTTDSEVFFFLILSNLSKLVDIHMHDLPLAPIFQAVRAALHKICEHVEVHGRQDGPEHETYLSFILTNGENLVAHNGGQTLNMSTHKNQCPVRTTCPHLQTSCESPIKRGAPARVNHLIISSEPLVGDNVWSPLALGETIAASKMLHVEWDMFDYQPYFARTNQPHQT